jgi:hypothetical protein
LKPSVEALNGHKRVPYLGLQGNPKFKLALLLAKLEGNSFQDLRELLQDLQGNVPVGCLDLCFGNLLLWASKSANDGIKDKKKLLRKET